MDEDLQLNKLPLFGSLDKPLFLERLYHWTQLGRCILPANKCSEKLVSLA